MNLGGECNALSLWLMDGKKGVIDSRSPRGIFGYAAYIADLCPASFPSPSPSFCSLCRAVSHAPRRAQLLGL
jgi:hypothetical protein